MYKSVLRAAPRRIASSRTLLLANNATRARFINTAPPARKSRSLKSSLARWGLAGGIVYFYINNDLFAGEQEAAIQSLDESIHHVQESKLPTLEAIVEEKRLREAQQVAANKKTEGNVERVAAVDEELEGEGDDGLEGLEEEAGQQGAFNPETGEINWDCPCLGGMAHGPCGDEFRAAFSCFVYSTEEPKGVECIEKFKGMQDCFRAHPEMYGSELEDDEDDIEDEIRAQEAQKAQDNEESAGQKLEAVETGSPAKSAAPRIAPTSAPKTETEQEATQEKEVTPTAVPKSESVAESKVAAPSTDETKPKASHDATTK